MICYIGECFFLGHQVESRETILSVFVWRPICPDALSVRFPHFNCTLHNVHTFTRTVQCTVNMR